MLRVVGEHPGIPRLAEVSLAFAGPQNYIGRAEIAKHAVQRALGGVIAQELHNAAAAQARIVIDAQAWAEEVSGFQLRGSKSLSWVIGCDGMRESTSRNQVNGSTPQCLQEATKLRRTAAVLPPLSLPKNVQLLRPSAISRLARSVAPLSISKSPSSRKRASASH